MAYQAWNTHCHRCGCKLGRGQGEYVAYPFPHALCNVHFADWKASNSTGRKIANKRKKQQANAGHQLPLTWKQEMEEEMFTQCSVCGHKFLTEEFGGSGTEVSASGCVCCL